MPELSAFLITKNESADIVGCLESLRGLADEIVVVDDQSTDNTVELCRRFGAKIFTRPLDGFAAQKQFALDQTTGAWAFSIDADERMTPELAQEIRSLIASNPASAGFEVRRNFYFLGHRLRFGGQGADWVLRLFRRPQGRYRSVRVHESIEVSGAVGRLKHPLEHFSYATLEEYLEKRDHYTTLAAEDHWARGRRFTFWDTLRPAWEWVSRVVLKGAWLDGRAGLAYAKLSAQSTGMRAAKLRQMEKGEATTQRILIVRTDRIGDVLLTTPISRALRARFPQAQITWLVRPYTAPLLQNNPDVDQVIVDRGESSARLAQRLRAEKFDTAIVTFPRWRVACAIWRAGIPQRIGPASKLYSALFNHRIWQHRSEGKKHEADYNLELLEPLGVSFQRFPTRLVLTEEEKSWARAMLESMRISFQKPIIALHPGSGGSSSRWPLQHFMELGDRLQESGCDVMVTGGPGEDYQNIMIDQMRRIPVFIAAGSITIRQMAALWNCMDLVVSNSTGPLHLAVAVGTPTVSVYSPIPTCHPQRWGPYPAYAEGDPTHDVLMPRLDHGIPDEMASVTVDAVEAICRKKLSALQGKSLVGGKL